MIHIDSLFSDPSSGKSISDLYNQNRIDLGYTGNTYTLPGGAGLGVSSQKYWDAVNSGTMNEAMSNGMVNGRAIVNASSDSGNGDSDPLIEALSGWFDKLQTSADKANEIAQSNAVAANQFAHDEAELQRQWQENMSNTAYQRAYADMKAAGINPIIGFGAGASPASTPGGAAASATGAQTFKRDHNIADDVIAIAQIFATLVSSVTGAFKK